MDFNVNGSSSYAPSSSSSLSSQMDNSNQTLNATKQWEELRRRARQYEKDLDSKLFSFSKLLTSSSNRNNDVKTSNMKKYGESAKPLLDDDDNFDHMSHDIENILSMLRDINAQMSQQCQLMPNSSAATYTLQRHQEILQDYVKEYHKTKANVEAQLNREKLLAKNNDANDFSVSISKKSDYYLMKESDHIRNSEIMIDDHLNVARGTLNTLRHQRSMMKSVRTQLTTLANKFPMIKNVMQKIGVKKQKDAIILAIVIGVCLFLLLIYMF